MSEYNRKRIIAKKYPATNLIIFSNKNRIGTWRSVIGSLNFKDKIVIEYILWGR